MKKQKELFRAYLKSNPNPTWSDIIDALVKIGKEDIARKVVDTFNLSPKLLATAVSQTPGKSVRPTSSLAKSRVEPDTAELEPARVSKTEVHSSVVVKPQANFFLSLELSPTMELLYQPKIYLLTSVQ